MNLSFEQWIFFVAGIFILVFFFFFYLYRSSKKRREDLEKFAQSRGLSFSKEEPHIRGLPSFHLFKQGGSSSFKNVIQGHLDGQDIKFFDYSFEINSGETNTTQTQTAIVFNVKDKKLPAFELRPEYFYHKIGALVGYNDIDFQEDPQFSKKYLLKGKDEGAIRNLFHSQIRNYFLKNEKWCAEGDGQWLIVYKAGKKAKVDSLPQFLNQTFEIFRLFC